MSGSGQRIPKARFNNFFKTVYSGTPFIPREIMLPEEIEDHEVLAEWLTEKRGARVYIRVPQKV